MPAELGWPRKPTTATKRQNLTTRPFASLLASTNKRGTASAEPDAQPLQTESGATENVAHPKDAKSESKEAAAEPAVPRASLLRRLRDSHNDSAQDQSSGAESPFGAGKQLDGKADRCSSTHLNVLSNHTVFIRYTRHISPTSCLLDLNITMTFTEIREYIQKDVQSL